MTLLKTLKLNGMAAAWDDVLSQDKQRKGSFEEVRGALAQAELSHRKAQSIHYQMKLATFPVYRNLAAFAAHAVRQRYKVRYFNVVDLINQLEQEQRTGHSGRLTERLKRHIQLIVLD